MNQYSVATLNQTPLDWSGNRQRILGAIQEAKKLGSSLLVLPELALSGAGCQNHFRRADVLRQALDSLEKIVPETTGLNLLVNVGFPFGINGKRYNAAAWIYNGRIAFIHCKKRLEKRYYDEELWFDPWVKKPDWTSFCELFGEKIPYGDFSKFHYPDTWTLFLDRLGVNDVFYPPENDSKFVYVHQEIGEPDWEEFQHPVEQVDLRIISSASPFALDKHGRREISLQLFSEQNSCVCLYANLLGCEGTPFIYDGATQIADHGETVQSQRFSYREYEVLSCRRAVTPPIFIADEFDRAVPLALFDYLRKSRSCGYVLSLSGGADSAAVAVLVASMVRYAWSELQPQEFFKRLDFIPELDECRTPEEATAKLLTCVYQRTQNNSDTTRNAAKNLAESLGAAFHEIDIEPLVTEYKNLIAPIYGKPLTWEANDTPLQNIQARARVPAIWLLANLKNALLLNAGNRSEAAVGYTTMDGDTCGALAPIGGIDKVSIRRWLRWKETGSEFPVPGLRAVNEQEPTAELRPPSCVQTDENDLMPYPILWRLEQLIIRDGLSLKDAAKWLLETDAEFTENGVQCWVERFYRLWTRNQWKRKRYAMSFHVDDETVPQSDSDNYPNFCMIES